MKGVPYSTDFFPRGDGGTPDEQIIIWEGESKMHPWGDIRKILVFFWQILQKKILKNQGCILGKIFV